MRIEISHDYNLFYATKGIKRYEARQGSALPGVGLFLFENIIFGHNCKGIERINITDQDMTRVFS